MVYVQNYIQRCFSVRNKHKHTYIIIVSILDPRVDTTIHFSSRICNGNYKGAAKNVPDAVYKLPDVQKSDEQA